MGTARTAAARERLIRRIAKPFVFAVCLAPLAWLVWRAAMGGLGANPIEASNRFLGDWALRFLMITLYILHQRDRAITAKRVPSWFESRGWFRWHGR